MIEVDVSAPEWSLTHEGARVSFRVPTMEAAEAVCREIEPGKPYVASIKVKRQKRSKNANDLLWELVTRIAEKVGDSKEDIYRSYIRTYGACEYVAVPEAAVDRLIESWRRNGIGWIAERVDFIKGKEIQGAVKVCLYYGSSTYDTAEMSRLLDGVVQDCKALGIEIISESDRALLAMYPGGQR